jgi:dTDP-4-amino-4,6-dideoxygalactose transaminase
VVTPRTFIASISCVVNAEAVPVFADVEADSGNISARTIAAVLTPRTRAVICVHLAGWPCDMDPIMALAAQHDFKVIEDCAQAHGAIYKGRMVGSIGDIGAWSFCQDKIMSTGGEGGMITTNSEEFWRFSWEYKDHGKSHDAVYKRTHQDGYRWLHESFGTNWRMLEIQAVIGRLQLRKMAVWHSVRLQNLTHILNFCAGLPGLRVPKIPSYIQHAAYKCYVYLDHDVLADGWDRNLIVKEINRLGVCCFVGSCSEVYLEKAFDNSEFRPLLPLQNARILGETSLMLLVHPGLSDEYIEKTCEVIADVLSNAMAKPYRPL